MIVLIDDAAYADLGDHPQAACPVCAETGKIVYLDMYRVGKSLVPTSRCGVCRIRFYLAPKSSAGEIEYPDISGFKNPTIPHYCDDVKVENNLPYLEGTYIPWKTLDVELVRIFKNGMEFRHYEAICTDCGAAFFSEERVKG